MLVELAIQDLALIERATLTFGHGLNVITGETGAGKSLLIDALELLLGQRGRSGLVRAGAPKARVEGRFVMPREGYGDLVADWLGEHLPETLEDFEDEPGDELELILTRALGRDGRSRAHVNHRPVTQRMLRELASRLVEIHGQNDHQKLFDPGEQMRLLDTFGELSDTLAGYRERRATWLELAQSLDRFQTGEVERLQRLDLLRFQSRELAESGPSPEEKEGLVSEREVLRNAGDLGRELGGTVQEIVESDGAALDVLRRAERVLSDWSERVAELGVPAQAMREAVAHLEDAASGLVSFVDGVETDPVRLEAVEARLSEFEQLERKYRTDIHGLAARRSEIDAELATLELDSDGVEALVAEVQSARDALAESARRLGKSRRGLRTKLKKAVEKGLGDLGLERARFDVSFEARPDSGGDLDSDRRRFGQYGCDELEFQLAANPGESPGPLHKVASGGEMARIMLALRGALAVRQSTPTLIFDEVDTGVGGRLGPRVGSHLRGLAEHHQVLCVTHLPAIAAVAHQHLRVHKEVEGDRTRTHVAAIEDEVRVQEIADMIAGGAAADTAQAEARRLLEDRP
jgi:DNA repair protein RecN (Recombination protein N)